MFLHFNYNFFALLQNTLYLGCGNSHLRSDPSLPHVMLTQIKINIKARSALMFSEQKVVIPLTLLCSPCDSFNSSMCVADTCDLEKSKQNVLAKKDSFVLINLITLPMIDLM